MSSRFPMALLGASLLTLLSLSAPGCSDDGTTPSVPSGGSNSGSGGQMAAAGTAGAGGSVAGSASGSGGTAGSGTGGVSGGGGGGGGGASGAGAGGTGGGAGGSGSTYVACPPDATFCADFESPGLPAKAVYKVNAAPGEWSRDYEVDAAVFKNGKGALKVKAATDAGTSGSAYRMLAVPTPNSGAFWARFYVRQEDADIGGLKHNTFAGASDSDSPNADVMIEVAEDVGLAFNTDDVVRRPDGYGYVGSQQIAYTLPKGMWHCFQVQFDGEARVQKLFVGNVELINATDYPAQPKSLKFFKFGFDAPNGPPRHVWYDDVAVGPSKPPCE